MILAITTQCLAAQSFVTLCTKVYPRNLYLFSCSGSAYYQNTICDDVSIRIQSGTSTTYSLYDGSSISVLSSSAITTISTLAFIPGAPYLFPNGCSTDFVPTVSSSAYTLTTFYVTTFFPQVTSQASPSTVTETVTTSLTESVCEGSDSILTRYTTGPVPGTSTITSCSAP